MVPYGGGTGLLIPNRYGGFLTKHELGRASYKANKHAPVIDWSKKYY